MRRILLLSIVVLATGYSSCTKVQELGKRIEDLSLRISSLEKDVAAVNKNAIAIGKFLKGEDIRIVSYKTWEYGYTLDLSDGSSVEVVFGKDAPAILPLLTVDENGDWIVSMDGGTTFSPVPGADNIHETDGVTPQIRISDKGYWQVSLDGGRRYNNILDADGRLISAVDGYQVTGQTSVFKNVVYDQEESTMTFTLQDNRTVVVPVEENFYIKLRGYMEDKTILIGETLVYNVDRSDVSSAIVRATEGWNVTLTDKIFSITAPADGTEGDVCVVEMLLVSTQGWLKTETVTFVLSTVNSVKTGIKTWDDWVDGNAQNVLPDFSYAGYNHGESVPPDAFELGYKVYDVTKYGAKPNDGKSDRAAVFAAYQAAIGGEGKVQEPNARAILYFPEGEYILHTSADNIDGKSQTMQFRAGSFVIKGAGVDKTTIVMQDPNLPASEELWSSPVMMEVKHYTGLQDLTRVTSNAAKGSFSVQVESTAGITVGDWVCLHVQDNNPDFVREEVSPYQPLPYMTNLIETGVQVSDFHQVRAVSGNTVTFIEPIMHAVDIRYSWTVKKYSHYERVGVEDITFKCNAKPDFKHHGSWQDDSGYRPLALNRVANGWVRRVRFTSVSEACSFASCANISAYDIEINGNRGHASVRSQGSSRVFIGKVWDHSDGPVAGSGTVVKGAGQFHAVGVSKPAMGTVLWRNTWGKDSCFESHATQPRTTLVDVCEGGWVQSRQGGDEGQLPNHLQDLVIWNFNSTTPFAGSWDWWRIDGNGWKFLPPIVVGFHGQPCEFVPSQVLVDESHGTRVEPESLYEAQLKQRLGYVPAWLNEIK